MNRYMVGLKNFSYCGVYADRFEVIDEFKVITFFVDDKEVCFFQIVDVSTIEILDYSKAFEQFKKLVYQEA